MSAKLHCTTVLECILVPVWSRDSCCDGQLTFIATETENKLGFRSAALTQRDITAVFGCDRESCQRWMIYEHANEIVEGQRRAHTNTYTYTHIHLPTYAKLDVWISLSAQISVTDGWMEYFTDSLHKIIQAGWMEWWIKGWMDVFVHFRKNLPILVDSFNVLCNNGNMPMTMP